MATTRSRLVSKTRHTAPMPPSPILAMISYDPNRMPGDNRMCVTPRRLDQLPGDTGDRAMALSVGCGTRGSDYIYLRGMSTLYRRHLVCNETT